MYVKLALPRFILSTFTRFESLSYIATWLHFQLTEWPWSYGSWIYNSSCNHCLSTLTLWFRIRPGEVYSIQHYVIKLSVTCDSRWFSPVSSTNKTDRHDITEILLKVALNTIYQTKPTNPTHRCLLYLQFIFTYLDLCRNRQLWCWYSQ